MDFEIRDTPEQEAFRQEVRAWFEENVRPTASQKLPLDHNDLTREQWEFWREARNKVGLKGWLAPMFPKEYGGGGLTMEQAAIVMEESANADIRHMDDFGQALCAPAIMVWGSEDLKRRILPRILTATDVTWQCFTEPDAGTDLASLKMRADKDGDDYVLNGQKIFVGAFGDVDWLYTLAITDQTKPRHANLGALMVPASTPGLTIQNLEIIARGYKRVIYYDNVRVAKTQLIGGETDGWKVAASTLEVEHGGFGRPSGHDPFFTKVLSYCQETKRYGAPLSKDPDVRDALVEVWMGSQVQRLFEMRNYWMRASRIPWKWEGAQTALYSKLREPKVAQLVLGMLGPYALTTDPELRPLAGEMEVQQRDSILTHPGGTPEAQKIVMARRIGITKTKQQAAAIH